MKKLNRRIEYALIALKYMCDKGSSSLSSVSEIVSATGVPYDVMARVMQNLTSYNILQSEQGVKGGYHLKLSIDEIKMSHLIEAIDGPIEITKCQTHKPKCELLQSCNIRSPINMLNHKLRDFYGNLNLGELLQVPGASEGARR